MKLERHVLAAIDDHADGKSDSAMMHACFAVEATARKLFRVKAATRTHFKECIRRYIWIVEVLMNAGINLESTIWNNIELTAESGKAMENPDFADIVYHVFRCFNAHGDAVPESFDLTLTIGSSATWEVASNTIKMPDRVIWGLVGISLFCNANSDILTSTDHEIWWGLSPDDDATDHFKVADWWGREDDFRKFADGKEVSRYTLHRLEKLRR